MLKDKVALVTGANRGIGLEIALTLAKAGATVIGTAITEEGAKSFTEQFAQENLSGCGKVLDITQRDLREQLINEINTQFGEILILINNAAVTRDNLMLRMKDEEWEDVINTNLSSTFYLTRLCLRDMLKTRWGRIVNISSVVGITGNPGQVNYSAAKAGLLGFTKSLAREVASRNVTVNAVAPGFIDTDMTRKLSEEHRKLLLSTVPAGRVGQPADIAQTVLFLISPAGDYITGQTLHVNGGMYMP